MIPVTYGGTDFRKMGAPPHSSINALKFKTASRLVEYLKLLQENDAKYAEYFWWREFYEVRNSEGDRAQAYCDLCKRLNDPQEPPKVIGDMYKWWVSDSHCKRLQAKTFE